MCGECSWSVNSPLHTIRHCSLTLTKLLFRGKIKFCETWQKEVYTLFVIDRSFCERVKYSWLDESRSYSTRYVAGIKIWYQKNVELMYHKR